MLHHPLVIVVPDKRANRKTKYARCRQTPGNLYQLPHYWPKSLNVSPNWETGYRGQVLPSRQITGQESLRSPAKVTFRRHLGVPVVEHRGPGTGLIVCPSQYFFDAHSLTLKIFSMRPPSHFWTRPIHNDRSLRERSLITTWGVGKLDTRMRQFFRFPLCESRKNDHSPLRKYMENLGPPHNKWPRIGVYHCLYSYFKR